MITKLNILENRIKKNIEIVKKINKNIIWVLKDDAYGLGIENILPILLKNNEKYIAVNSINEAMKVVDISNNINILILNYISSSYLQYIIDNKIEITIYSIEQLQEYITTGIDISKIKISIKINTGMNRLGFNKNNIYELIKLIKKYNINILSVFTHISNVEDEERLNKQIYNFEKILNILNDNDIEYRYKHVQASPLLFKYKEKYNYDYARIGMALYGLNPLDNKQNILNNSIELKTKIIHIVEVKENEYISYGKYKVYKDMKLAVIPVGYAHGIMKNIENSNAYMMINGQKAYIIGEICMDMIMLDITNIECNIGDSVNILDDYISLSDMAKWANTIQDDILVKLSKINKNIIGEK